MCCVRHVRNVYTKCGHGLTVSDEMVYCESSKCRSSLSHPATCKPPNCLKTCRQYKTPPKQYTPQINAFCPSCAPQQPQ